MKTKTLFLLSAILLAFMMLASACYRVEEMSDFNEIYRLEITSYTPEIEVRNEARIEDDVIFIDVDFGEFHFPLHFRAKPIFENEIDRIVGVDFSEELILQTPEDELTFFVMARSGMVRPYRIRARVADLNRDIMLCRFFEIKNVEPEMLISETGTIVSLEGIDGRRDTLTIFSVDGTFPVTITPRFNVEEKTSHFGEEIISPNGTRVPFDNGKTSLTFYNAESVYQLTVISESGLTNTWNIVMHHTPIVSGADGESTPEQLEGSNINPRTISATSQNAGVEEYIEVFVNNTTEEVFLLLKTKESFEFPLSVHVSFDISGGVQLLKLDESNKSAKSATLTFNGWNDVKQFFLLDTESRVSRLWSIGLREWKSSENNVLAFSYTYTATRVCHTLIPVVNICAGRGPAITLNTGSTVIFPGSPASTVGDIFLHMTDVATAATAAEPWGLTLNDVQITVSEGATLEELPQYHFVWTGNNSWVTPISFKVTAQDGTEKIWRVNIRDMRNHVPSSATDLTDFTIVRHVPNFAVFDAFADINNDERIITLRLVEDEGIYPLHVWFSAELSPLAQVTSQQNGTGPLIFQNEDSEQIITITAEDGRTSNWTVRLQPPPRETRAEVVNFQITSMNAQLAQITRNNETGAIRLWLGASATFPVVVDYVMTISPRATTPIPLRGTFTFNRYQDIDSFTITAQDGTTRDWTVRLVHEPQLPNATLDNWANSTMPVGWGTANWAAPNSTTQTTGNPGSAALMRTGSTMGMVSSGTLFLGQFNPLNLPITVGLTDPTRFTHFGKPFETSGHILGIEFDAIYSPGREYISGTNRELASAVIQLLRPIPGRENEPWVYHGSNTDGVPHANNTAEYVASAQAVLGNSPGTSWNNLPITVVSNTQWTRVRLLFDFPNGVKPDFTQLHVVFGSSAQGDAFRGVAGSELRIDNVRILYKEE